MIKRHLSNATWNISSLLLQTGAILAATPIILKGIGLEGYGILMLVNTLVGFNGLAAFGLADATVKQIASARARDDLAFITGVVRTTMALYIPLSFIFVVALYFGSLFLVDKVFHVEPSSTAAAVSALQAGAFIFLIRVFESVFSAVLQGFELYGLVARIELFTSVFALVLQCFLASSGHGVLPLTLATGFGILLSAIAKLGFGIARCVSARAFVPGLQKDLLKPLFSFGLFSWFQTLNGVITGQADRLLLASMLDVKALAAYTIALRVASFIHMIPTRAASFLFPVAAYQAEQGNTAALRNTYFTAQNITTSFGTAMAVTIFLLASPLLTLWVGPKVSSEAAPVLRLLTIVYACLATTIVPYYYMNGSGFVRLNTVFGTLASIISIGLTYLGIPRFGVIAPAGAQLCSHVMSFIAYPILHRRLFGDNRWYVGFSVLSPLFGSFAIALLVQNLIPAKFTLFEFFSIAVFLFCMIFPVALILSSGLNTPPDTKGTEAVRVVLSKIKMALNFVKVKVPFVRL